MTPPAARVACVITWFHPAPDAWRRLEHVREQCDLVVVVDNTPDPVHESPREQPARVLRLEQGGNSGLAGALNAALRILPESVEQVLFLDQDSTMPTGGVQQLAEHLDDPRVAVSAGLPWDAKSGRAVDPRHRPRASRPVREVDAVITSGMLVRRDALRAAGPFREDFFVDAVDQDMCLRLRAAGWQILQDRRVRVEHELGDLVWRRVLGVSLRSTRHPTWRLYAAARNGAVLLREHGMKRPVWAATYILQSLYWLLGVVLLEPPRRARLAAHLRGTVDGLLSRGSSAPPDVEVDLPVV